MGEKKLGSLSPLRPHVLRPWETPNSTSSLASEKWVGWTGQESLDPRLGSRKFRGFGEIGRRSGDCGEREDALP